MLFIRGIKNIGLFIGFIMVIMVITGLLDV